MRTPGRELAAAFGTLGAYAFTVLPQVRRELRALGPLPPGKESNAEAVAVFATLAPRERRAIAVRGIVALQAAIDLRDELEEAGGDAAAPAVADRIQFLEIEWRLALAKLPGQASVLPIVNRAVERCRLGQANTHRAAREGPEPLRRWAAELEPDGDYRWWEVAAGASSSVAAHALIAAAADETTTARIAALVDAAYHPSIGALTVLLDDLVDREEDRAAGEHNYLAYYESGEGAGERLALMAREATSDLGLLPHADRHRAILAGVAAYYLSSPETETEYAAPIRARLLAALGPGTRLLAGFARARRLAGRKWPGQAGNSPEPSA